MEDELLTAEELAELLHIHLDSVRRMMRQKRLPAVKVGRRWYVRRADFDALLTQRAQPDTQ